MNQWKWRAGLIAYSVSLGMSYAVAVHLYGGSHALASLSISTVLVPAAIWWAAWRRWSRLLFGAGAVAALILGVGFIVALFANGFTLFAWANLAAFAVGGAYFGWVGYHHGDRIVNSALKRARY
jgi:hypothetical protein